jgi:hypothetical protein
MRLEPEPERQMPSLQTEERKVIRLRTQRRFFVVLAACSLASMGLAVPRRVASYRELRTVNARLVELRAAIVENQNQIRAIQEQIVRFQKEISERQAK